MTHYFSENNDTLKSNPQVIAFSVNNTPLKFSTDNGVFSKKSLDRGTDVLLKYLEVDDTVVSALDLGCGYGVIGIYLNIAFKLEVDMVDINLRAVELSKKNVELNGANALVFQSDGFENVRKKYDLIVTNPPIRVGKEIIYKFYEDAAKHLNRNGSFYLVINKKHGADSTFVKLKTIYQTVELIDRKKGFHVYRCRI
ncbi:MAG: methyltransferase [Firmicutes bacterium]|nr:methyltransferase [Bacillota bacterium]